MEILFLYVFISERISRDDSSFKTTSCVLGEFRTVFENVLFFNETTLISFIVLSDPFLTEGRKLFLALEVYLAGFTGEIY